MRTRPWLVLAALFIQVASAHADDHSAEFFGAAAYADGSHLWGFTVASAFTPYPRHYAGPKLLSVVMDTSAHFGSHEGATFRRTTYLFGPRVTFSQAPSNPHKVHAQVLFGGVHTNDAGLGSDDLAVAFGGAYEWLPGGLFSNSRGSRVEAYRWAVRGQVDYVTVGGDRENFLRVSGGLVYRITKD